MQLNPNKPQGPSKILYWVLRDGAVHLSEPLNFPFNEYLDILQFLSSLKKANITPLFKKGDTEDPLNYKTISPIPSLGNFFETLLKGQIIDFIRKTRLLSKTQFGFQQNLSTIDALVYLTKTVCV